MNYRKVERNQKSKEKGITLITLVITIIVLIILATVSIGILGGENGIIKKSKYAKEQTEIAQEIDILKLCTALAMGEDPDGNITETNLRNELDKNIKNYTLEAKVDKFKVVFESGRTYIVDTSGNIIENADSWGDSQETGPKQGEIMVENKEYKDAEGKIAIIPKGFCVVIGTDPISKGLVISDAENDDMENTKGGNQFVWIPVDGENLKYEQHKYAEPNADDHKNYLEDTGNGKWKTWQYRNYTGWTDTNGNTESVARNKGFYVGRYEAGIPKEAPFYSDEDGSTYWQQVYENDDFGKNSLTEGSYAKTYQDKNVTTYKPVSKKNTPSWNFISQINAKEISSKMYGEEKGVTSQLIDSYAYDTIAQWLSNSSYDVTNSTAWGNYINSEYEINGLYAKHEYRDKWYPAYTWSKGAYSKENGERFEIATGSSERNKVNNIYDFAGNMWEWTTETRTGTRTDWNSTTEKDTETEEQMFTVVRGGSFVHYGSDNAASFRNGNPTTGHTSVNFGFRVILYIK